MIQQIIMIIGILESPESDSGLRNTGLSVQNTQKCFTNIVPWTHHESKTQKSRMKWAKIHCVYSTVSARQLLPDDCQMPARCLTRHLHQL